MYLYVFMTTAPGMAQQVMNEVVAQGAARAVAITGPYDVVAKYVDITWDELAKRSLSPSQIVGVVSTSTAVVASPSTTTVEWPPLPMPFSSAKWGPRCALVLMKTSSGEIGDAFGKLRRKDTVKAIVPLFGEYDLMAQICGKDEKDIARQLVKALADVPEIRSTLTCLILAAHPEKGDSRGGGYKRRKRR